VNEDAACEEAVEGKKVWNEWSSRFTKKISSLGDVVRYPLTTKGVADRLVLKRR
jgi:hypothetical protein